MSGKPSIYWDTCIFLSWLTDEIRNNPDDKLGVEKLALLFDQNQISIVTSTITLVEILESKINPEEYQKFRQLLSRRNFLLVDVTKEIAEISHDIRNYYAKPGESTLKVPDCIHLATAISMDCGAFYTFDGESQRKNTILMLSKPIAGKYDISIQVPQPDKVLQLSVLEFREPVVTDEIE